LLHEAKFETRNKISKQNLLLEAFLLQIHNRIQLTPHKIFPTIQNSTLNSSTCCPSGQRRRFSRFSTKFYH